MWNGILDNAEWIFSGIGVVILSAIVGWFIRMWQRTKRKDQDQSPQSIATLELMRTPKSPSKCEFLSLSFEISLSQEIPKIDLWIYAVNHLSRELVFQSLRVTQFYLSGGPSLENIPSNNEIRIPPRRTREVLLRRALTDSEVRAISRKEHRNPCNATFSLAASGTSARKRLTSDSVSISVNGWISGMMQTD